MPPCTFSAAILPYNIRTQRPGPLGWYNRRRILQALRLLAVEDTSSSDTVPPPERVTDTLPSQRIADSRETVTGRPPENGENRIGFPLCGLSECPYWLLCRPALAAFCGGTACLRACRKPPRMFFPSATGVACRLAVLRQLVQRRNVRRPSAMVSTSVAVSVEDTASASTEDACHPIPGVIRAKRTVTPPLRRVDPPMLSHTFPFVHIGISLDILIEVSLAYGWPLLHPWLRTYPSISPWRLGVHAPSTLPLSSVG